MDNNVQDPTMMERTGEYHDTEHHHKTNTEGRSWQTITLQALLPLYIGLVQGGTAFPRSSHVVCGFPREGRARPSYPNLQVGSQLLEAFRSSSSQAMSGTRLGM